MKYIDADKLKAEIERLKSTNPSEYNYQNAEGYTWALDDLLSFIDTFSEEPDKSLEKAANNYLDGVYGKLPHSDLHIAIFIAGAKWQEGQLLKGSPLPEDTVIFQNGIAEGKRLMLEDAVEGFVATHLTSEGTKITVNSGYLPKEMCIKPGEKVRIIIVKEEKNGQSD